MLKFSPILFYLVQITLVAKIFIILSKVIIIKGLKRKHKHNNNKGHVLTHSYLCLMCIRLEYTMNQYLNLNIAKTGIPSYVSWEPNQSIVTLVDNTSEGPINTNT